MKCKVTQLARESNGLCPLLWFIREGIQVITQLSTKQDYENNSCTQFAPEVQNLTLKKAYCLRDYFAQTILPNHLHF